MFVGSPAAGGHNERTFVLVWLGMIASYSDLRAAVLFDRKDVHILGTRSAMAQAVARSRSDDDLFFQMKSPRRQAHRRGIESRHNTDALLGLLEPCPNWYRGPEFPQPTDSSHRKSPRGPANLSHRLSSHVQRELAVQAQNAGCSEVMRALPSRKGSRKS